MSDLQDLFNKAVQAFNEGRIDEANLALLHTVNITKEIEDNPNYLFLSGLIDDHSGRSALAVHQLKRAFSAAPRRIDILDHLGRILLKTGDLEGAAHYMNKARLIRKHDGKEDVFVFGDSHSDFLFSGIARCKVHWLGPVTMHRIGRDGLGFLDLRTFGVPDGATAVFVFGEIDVRTHVLRQRDTTGRELDEIVDTLCRRYVDTIVRNRAQYRRLTCAICSVVPQTMSETNSQAPFYGDLSERIIATGKVNSLLRALCAEHDLLYLDVHRYFVDRSGLMIRAISDRLVHVRKEFCGLVEHELESRLAEAEPVG